MFSRALLQSILFISICAGALPAQTPTKVDFARDVLPILRQNCIGCHGPAKQMNSYRLDQRGVADARPGFTWEFGLEPALPPPHLQ